MRIARVRRSSCLPLTHSLRPSSLAPVPSPRLSVLPSPFLRTKTPLRALHCFFTLSLDVLLIDVLPFCRFFGLFVLLSDLALRSCKRESRVAVGFGIDTTDKIHKTGWMDGHIE